MSEPELSSSPQGENDSHCPVCKNPRQNSGSLTQWIVTCSCSELASDAVQAPELCKICGKQITANKHGSLTQFIFQSDTCSCNYRGDIRPVVNGASTAEIVEDVHEQEPEVYLECEPENFPVERYAPKSCLGMGADGTVFLCRDKMLNKLVAVKTLNRLKPKQLIAFQAQAKEMSKLNHPSVAGILDFGVTPGSVPYMVLEYADGQSVEDLLELRGALDWRQTRFIFNSLCDALSHAHQQGVLHRDIKPGNIIICENDGAQVVRLIDFGISEHEMLNQSDLPVGTPLYMPPESVLRQPYDERSEVYSVACVLFAVLTGRPPFEGDDALQTMKLHVEGQPPVLSERAKDTVPPALDRIMERALAKDPNNRFQNINEFRDALVNADFDSKRQDERHDDPVSPDKGKKPGWLPLIAAIAIAGLLGCLAVMNTHLPDSKPKAVEVSRQKQKSFIERVSGEKVKGTHQNWKIDGSTAVGPNVSDEDFAVLASAPIEEINIGIDSSASGIGLRYLVKKPLKVVTFQNENFNEEGASWLAKFKTVQGLNIHDSGHVTNKMIQHIAAMPALSNLQLRYVELPTTTIQTLSNSKTLRFLNLGFSRPFNHSDFSHIASIRGLELLCVSNSEFDDSYLPMLEKSSVSNLAVNGTNVSDKGLVELASFKTLKELRIGSNHSVMAIESFKSKMPTCKLIVSD